MSDESEIGVVLENAPKIAKAYGPNRGMVVTLVSLYLLRRRIGIVGLVTSVFTALAAGLQVWIYNWA